MRYHHFGDGRFVLRLDAGEEVIASLRSFAVAEKVEAAWISGLGSFDHLTLGFLDPETNEYVRRRFEERMEVGNLSGTISREEDRPFIHLHAVVSPRELLAYTGHVHEAKVGAVLEVFVTVYPGRLDRRLLSGQAFPALLLPGEIEPEGNPPTR
jgi:predicted DNA-binding protein with PD1-like motif